MLAQLEEEKQSLATIKAASLQKTDVINSLTKGIEEWRQKVTNLQQINAKAILQGKQEVEQLTEANKDLKDMVHYLQCAIAEVEIRA